MHCKDAIIENIYMLHVGLERYRFAAFGPFPFETMTQ